MQSRSRTRNNQVKDWLMKLRDVAYDADDVLSDFSTEDLRRRVMYGDKMAKKVRIFFSSSNQLAFRFKMAHKIKAIREKLDAIANDKNNLQLVVSPLQTRDVARERDQTHSFILEEEVIGREEDKNTLIDMLLNINEEENVSFISIVGIGGLGKTTLAQYVYNDEKVKTYFDLKMWVCVSDVFDVKAIVEKIIGSTIGMKPQNLDIDPLQTKLRDQLNQKKYLLVLDDVWNDDAERWSNLKRLLMGGSKGSKVVITTRSGLVAKITSPIPPYVLQGLSNNQSWSLFKQMAFEKGQKTIDPKLEEIGMDILEKCYGVPLAIKTTRRMLLFKENEEEWLYIKDKELTSVTQGVKNNGILPILKLSYDHLPSHLKCCFTYCSLFPKDYEIPKSMLIQLWIAQGFVQPANEKLQLEDVANEYCMDLLWRSFFQEAEEDKLGNIISFKMHDLIHDMAQSVSRIECTYFDFNAKVVIEKVRHLSFPSFRDFEDDLSSLVKVKKIRTFLIFYYGSLQEESTLKKLISSFRCLRVLDLHDLEIVTVPNSINKLTYLKYLDLSYNDIEVLPNSFVRLLNLQTLKLSRCMKLKELPRDIQKLICLKHLEIDDCVSLTHVPSGLGQLTSLHTLKLSGCENLKELPRDIQKLISLKHLEIDGCESLTHMPCGIGQLTSLQTLPLFVVSKDLKASSAKHCGGLAELNKLNNLRGELSIKNLAWVRDATLEAKAANLKEKRHLRSLKLSWDSADNNETYVSKDENLLEGLQPHHTLKKLNVERYQGVSFPSWLPSVTSLVKLKISSSMCQHLPPLYQLPSLRKLSLKNMIGLEYISDREITDEVSASTTFFPSLKFLQLRNCPNLKGWWRSDIVDVATMTSISSDQYQQHISLPSFPCLSYLDIGNCNNPTCMPLFPYLEENLLLWSTSFKPLQDTMAMTMNMSATSSLPSSSSSSFPPLSKLKSLTLSGIQDVESLPEELLQNLASLEYLTIWACPRLKSLPRFMQHLISLKKLDIGLCKELDLFNEESDDGTQCVTTLQELYISVDHRLITLPKWIGNVTSLQRLKIRYCPNLTSIPEGIGSLTSIRDLCIEGCPNLTSLPEGIGNLTSLQSLRIFYCPNLISLPKRIGNLTSLQTLIIINCPHLKERCQEGIGEDWHKIAHIPDFEYFD
uniref:NB-ARC domain-containing protein n=1 Tax=Fagus sylvatica TaxID=28930 RepID=A0A2N9H1Y4_FAGSY